MQGKTVHSKDVTLLGRGPEEGQLEKQTDGEKPTGKGGGEKGRGQKTILRGRGGEGGGTYSLRITKFPRVGK